MASVPPAVADSLLRVTLEIELGKFPLMSGFAYHDAGRFCLSIRVVRCNLLRIAAAVCLS